MKEIMNKMSLKDMWKYIVFQTQNYRIYRLLLVLGIISEAALPYVNSVLSAEILDNLIAKEISLAKLYVFVLILLTLFLSGVDKYCLRMLEYYAKLSSMNIRKRTINKAFAIKYSELEKKDNLQALRRIRTGERGNGGLETQIKNIYKYFCASFKVIISCFFLLFLCIMTIKGNSRSYIWILGLMGLLIGMTMLLIYGNKMNKKVGKLSVDMCKRNEEINATGTYLLDTIENEANAKDILIYDLKDYINNKFKKYFDMGKEYSKFGGKKGQINGIITFLYQLLSGAIYIYISLLAVYGMISIGQIVMYSTAIISLFSAIQLTMRLKVGIEYKNEYLKIYEEFINNSKTNLITGNESISIDQKWNLQFDHVSFSYNNSEKSVIKNINFTINKGERIALVGVNGAGKTTIIKLICRLYEPTEGKIMLNGRNIADYKYEDYMSFVSVVFQDFQLFDFSIEENIVAGEKNIDKEKEYSVIEKVGLTSRINKLGEKENTIINHENGNGTCFSGGELQKLSIARALYKDSELIILDEPTASLDPIAEANIYENFNDLVKNKTAIYISHRMSSCKFCQRIIVIEDGQEIETGNHDELMGKKGKYFELYSAQKKFYK